MRREAPSRSAVVVRVLPVAPRSAFTRSVEMLWFQMKRLSRRTKRLSVRVTTSSEGPRTDGTEIWWTASTTASTNRLKYIRFLTTHRTAQHLSAIDPIHHIIDYMSSHPPWWWKFHHDPPRHRSIRSVVIYFSCRKNNRARFVKGGRATSRGHETGFRPSLRRTKPSVRAASPWPPVRWRRERTLALAAARP